VNKPARIGKGPVTLLPDVHVMKAGKSVASFELIDRTPRAADAFAPLAHARAEAKRVGGTLFVSDETTLDSWAYAQIGEAPRRIARLLVLGPAFVRRLALIAEWCARDITPRALEAAALEFDATGKRGLAKHALALRKQAQRLRALKTISWQSIRSTRAAEAAEAAAEVAEVAEEAAEVAEVAEVAEESTANRHWAIRRARWVVGYVGRTFAVTLAIPGVDHVALGISAGDLIARLESVS
jgi:hypothetical protein